jgi:hypothetical protein
MGSYDLVNRRMSLRNHSLQSKQICAPSRDPLKINLMCRQRREHHVFGVLIQMVPGLETRLMEGLEEDLVSIAEMVCPIIFYVKDNC